MSNFAITGASGFLGTHVSHTLNRAGHGVLAIIREQPAGRGFRNCFSFDPVSAGPELAHQANLVRSLAEKLRDENVSTLIHLAAEFVSHHSLPEHALSLVNSNIFYGAAILEACKIAGVTRIVSAGTSWQNYQGAHYHPVSMYAATREAFEKIAMHYTLNEQFQIDALHFFDTYGPGDSRKKLLPLLRAHFLECLAAYRRSQPLPEPLKLGPCTQLINLLHIEDAASAVCVAANSPGIQGRIPVFSVRSPHSVPMQELLEIVGRHFFTLTRRELPLAVGHLPGRPREMQTDWVFGESLSGWRPKIDLQTGINHYFLSNTEPL